MYGESTSHEKSVKFIGSMLKSMLSYIEENNLFSPKDKILLGVSGGVDSIVMLHLLIRAGYEAGMAHCNFQLRGSESEEDHRFVAWLAENYNIPFFVKKFDTHQYASEQGISIQMAARRLRFEWFEHLRHKHNYNYIAIAHNKNDKVETSLINLARGTGLKGITGIKPKSGFIVRPLLFAGRNDILHYCNQEGLNYREDSSNQTTKYSRNLIRHEIIPEFQKINSQFPETMDKNLNRFHSAYALFEFMISEIRERLLIKQGNDWIINFELLSEYPENYTILYELLKPFRFTADVVSDIFSSLETESGKTFYSDSYKAVKDRTTLIITTRETYEPKRYYIDREVSKIESPLTLTFKVENADDTFQIPRDAHTACIDYDLVEFPLIIRKWQSGDFFKPLGFGHYKKLSDFFIDNKYSLVDKEQTWLLTSGEQIVWVVGARLDDRFKITKQTSKVLIIEHTPDG